MASPLEKPVADSPGHRSLCSQVQGCFLLPEYPKQQLALPSYQTGKSRALRTGSSQVSVTQCPSPSREDWQQSPGPRELTWDGQMSGGTSLQTPARHLVLVRHPLWETGLRSRSPAMSTCVGWEVIYIGLLIPRWAS